MSASDLAEMFVPSGSLLALVLRGVLMYLAIFILMRVVLNRRSQGISMPDVLLIVLVADAAQNGMANEYRSITEGLVLVLTILSCDLALDWLAFRVPAIEALTRQPPLLLIENGRPLRGNMRQELITMSELEGLLREHDIVDMRTVARAYLESSGKLSVVQGKQPDR